MLSDLTKKIADACGVNTADKAIAFRGPFIIDKSGILRHSSINDLPVGRNPEETLFVSESVPLIHVSKV